MIMERIIVNLTTGKAHRVKKDGKSYLVAPAVSIVCGVMRGSAGPIFYSPEQTKASVPLWNGVPIVLRHPMLEDKFISVRNEGVLDQYGLGYLQDSKFNGNKLRHSMWFDEERVKELDSVLHKSLVNGERVEVSTGLDADLQEAPEGSTYDGVAYTNSALNYRPDHLAVLPDQRGACDIKRGCGIFANTLTTKTIEVDPRGTIWEDGTPVVFEESGLPVNPNLVSNAYLTNPKGKWTPPPAGNAPKGVKDILRKVYAAFRDKNPAENAATKTRGAKIAWAAVKKAGWVKGSDGKWKKRKEAANSEGVTMPNRLKGMFSKFLKSFTTNQPSHGDINSQLSSQLRKKLIPASADPMSEMVEYPWVHDVYDKYVIYSYQQKLYKIGYKTDLRSDTVELSDDEPVEVKRVTSYKTVRNDSPQGDDSMGFKYSTPDLKKADVDFLLTANCQCNSSFPWHSKDVTFLNALSDEVLNTYAQWAKSVAEAKPAAPAPAATPPTPAPLTFNNVEELGQALASVIMKAIPTAAPVGTPVAHPAAQPVVNTPAPSPQPAKAYSLDEWMKDPKVPEEAKRAVVRGMEAENKEKTELVGILTANLADGEAKDQATTIYNGMSLEALRPLAEATPRKEETPTLKTPSYFGGHGGPVANVTEEPLLPPTYNFGKTA